MKHILIVQGGGRPRGNTAQLVEHFAQGARDAGHQVETVSLLQVPVNGCLGCNACRYGKPCVQKDGFQQLIPKIQWADLLVLASPCILDHLRQAQSLHRALLLHCPARRPPAPGPL